jgi:thiol-disulfide isomerase/thioredoxin
MKLTYIISAVALSALLFSCGSKETTDSKDSKNSQDTPSKADGLIINGTMNNAAEATVYLFSFATEKPQKLDSTIVDANGGFMLKTDQNGYEIMGVGFTPVESVPLIVNTGEQITMNGTKDSWTKETTVKGSMNSESMIAYNKRRLKFSVDMQGLREIYNQTDQNDAAAVADINTKGMALQADFEKYKSEYINTNIDKPAIVAAIPDITNIAGDLERFTKMEATVVKFFPETSFAKSVTKMLNQTIDFNANKAQQQQQKPQGFAIGTAAPELDFASPDGTKIKLSSLKGQVVLLDFWASWCGPCRKENPNVVDVYNRYKDKGFTVYSVSLDNKKPNWLAAIKKDGLEWPNHVSDLKGWQSDAAAIYGINSIPMTYLLDADGIIVASNLRGAQLETKIKEILK